MGGILLKGGRLEEESIRDLVQEAIGSCSPLELTATWVFLESTSVCFWNSPLEVVTLSLQWSPLEVVAG